MKHPPEKLIIRPARPSDKAGTLALVAQIWEGNDYIPEVWDEWLADQQGELTVAELDGRVVCVAKLSCLRPGHWWLAGMRVDPAFQGRGIAKAVTRYQLDLAARIAEGTLGLGTSSENAPVHHMMDRFGFERVAAFKKYTAAGLPASAPSPFRAATAADHDWVANWLKTAPGFQATHGLVEKFWSWHPLLPVLGAELAAGRLFLWTPSGESPAGLVQLAHTDGERVLFGLADAPLHRLAALFRDVRRWPAAGERNLIYKTPATEAHTDALVAAGWETDWDNDMWVFHKLLENNRRI